MTYAETFSIALRSSDTGLTLKAALRGTDGTIDATLRDITTGFSEHGAGQYQWRYASFADGFNGTVVFYVGTLGAASDFSGVTVKANGVAGLVEKVANAVSSSLGGNAVTITSPVASDGTTITVVQGDDYSGSRAITWTGSSANQWPDLTGATLAFRATMVGALPVEAVPTVTTPTGTQVFTMSLTDTQTSTPVGRYRYDVQATLSGGDVVTLLRGAFVVQRTYTNEP